MDPAYIIKGSQLHLLGIKDDPYIEEYYVNFLASYDEISGCLLYPKEYPGKLSDIPTLLVGSSSLSLSSELFTSFIKSDSFFIDVSDVSTLLKDVEFLGHGSCLVQTDRGLSPVIFLFFKKENQYMEFVYHTTWKGLSEEPKFLFYQTDSIYDLSLQNCDFVWMRQKTFKFVPSIDMDETFSTHMFKMYVVEKHCLEETMYGFVSEDVKTKFSITFSYSDCEFPFDSTVKILALPFEEDGNLCLETLPAEEADPFDPFQSEMQFQEDLNINPRKIPKNIDHIRLFLITDNSLNFQICFPIEICIFQNEVPIASYQSPEIKNFNFSVMEIGQWKRTKHHWRFESLFQEQSEDWNTIFNRF